MKGLRRAKKAQGLARIDRSPRNAHRIVGFVVGVGKKWAIVAATADGGHFDGYVAIRVKDITNVWKDTSFEGRFARTLPEWPPQCPGGLDLERTGTLIKGLGALAPLIGIEQERRYKSAMTWIGALHDVNDGRVWLHEVRPDATWEDYVAGYKLTRVTKVSLGNQYQRALSVMAGDAPDW